MNINNLFKAIRAIAIVIAVSTSAFAWSWGSHSNSREIRHTLVYKIENLKKKAHYLHANPNNFPLIQQFVQDKVDYVNYMRANARTIHSLLEGYDMNVFVDEATIYLNERLDNVHPGMLAYAMEVAGYWDFDDISELNVNCIDDVEVKHKPRYMNHHKWVRTYRPDGRGPLPPAPMPPAPHPAPKPMPPAPHPAPKPMPPAPHPAPKPMPNINKVPAHQPAHGNQNFRPQPPQPAKPAPAPKPMTKPMPPAQQNKPPFPGQPR